MAEGSLLGSTFGHIRVVDLLGRGGMGEVYVGYDETLQRRVALKTIHARQRLTPSAKARFLREARILSALAHPNICQIHDFLETPVGELLVLELIRGETLEASIRRGIHPERAFEIADRICDVLAVAHAHGVVHRDLKVDNVMITDEGLVKVLDFGIARALPRDDGTLVLGDDESPRPAPPELPVGDSATEIDAVVGTPRTMSPEQARGEALTVASDLYSLGLVLQELFTGRPPHPAGLDGRALIARAIRGESLPVEGVDRDLAALVASLKALDPGARPTARQVQERLRWVRGKPRRRLRRLAAAAAALALLAAGAKYTLDLRRERNAALEAERRAEASAEAERQISEFLVGLFEVSDPGRTRGETVTAREILDRGAERIEVELTEQPLTHARLMHTMGTVYWKLGLYEPAARLVERAIERRERYLGTDHPEVAQSLNRVGNIYFNQGRYAEAEAVLRRGLDIAERKLGPDHPDVAATLNTLGIVCAQQGRLDEAEPFFRRALEIRERALGADHPEVAQGVNNLAALYWFQGEYGKAEPLYRRSLETRERTLGPDHPDVAQSLNNLGILYSVQRRFPEAQELFERALSIDEKVLGPEHPQLATTLYNLGHLHRDQRRWAKAEPFLRRALAIQEKALEPGHPAVGNSLARLGEARLAQSDRREGTSLLERAIGVLETALGADSAELADPLSALARHYRDAGEPTRADAHFARALAIRERHARPGDAELGALAADYAALLRSTGRTREAGALEARLAASATPAPGAPTLRTAKGPG